MASGCFSVKKKLGDYNVQLQLQSYKNNHVLKKIIFVTNTNVFKLPSNLLIREHVAQTL